MEIWVILLRLLHIVSGVFWAGSGLTVAGFIIPAVRQAGPGGAQFMQRLAAGRFTQVSTVAAAVTILAGLVLYWRDSAGFQLQWIATGPGIGFTLGALAGIAAGAVGGSITGPTIAKLGKLGQEIERGGKPPTADQAAELGRLQARAIQSGRWNAILVGIAVLFMATARYL